MVRQSRRDAARAWYLEHNKNVTEKTERAPRVDLGAYGMGAAVGRDVKVRKAVAAPPTTNPKRLLGKG